MAITGSLSATLALTQTSSSGLGTGSYGVNQTSSISFASGVLADQVNVLWSSVRALAATSELLDLNGILVDAYGASVTLLRVKGIYIANLGVVDAANLLVGGAASNGWISMFGGPGDRIAVGPGGFFLNVSPLATAWPVTAGTADLLKVDSGTFNISYSLAVLGCNA